MYRDDPAIRRFSAWIESLPDGVKAKALWGGSDDMLIERAHDGCRASARLLLHAAHDQLVKALAIEGTFVHAAPVQFLAEALEKIVYRQVAADEALHLKRKPRRDPYENDYRDNRITAAFALLKRADPNRSNFDIDGEIADRLNACNVAGPKDGWTADLVMKARKSAKRRKNNVELFQ